MGRINLYVSQAGEQLLREGKPDTDFLASYVASGIRTQRLTLDEERRMGGTGDTLATIDASRVNKETGVKYDDCYGESTVRD